MAEVMPATELGYKFKLEGTSTDQLVSVSSPAILSGTCVQVVIPGQ